MALRRRSTSQKSELEHHAGKCLKAQGWDLAGVDCTCPPGWPRKARTHKYSAERTEVDGITFDSKAEARHYQDLKLLERAGEIRNLELQPRFPLYVKCALTGENVPIGAYRGDFRYEKRYRVNGVENWRLVVDDVKGMDTPLSKWKRKHTELAYGIEITIVRRTR